MKILEKTSLGSNGVAQITMNYCMELRDQNSYCFIVCDDPSTTREDFSEICNENNWRIYYVVSPFRNPFQYFRKIKEIIKTGEFDLYHINGNSALMLLDAIWAKRERLPVITHCHNTSSRIKALHYCIKPLLGYLKCTKIACSYESGIWAYGKQRFEIIRNAIDYERFQYRIAYREEIRERYGLNDEIILLQVGNFNVEKNHLFTILFFEKLYNINPSFRLVFCGDGSRREELQKNVAEKHFENVVIFAGNQKNIEKFYSAADAFLLPSIFEGMPLVAIEAQISGLKCFISSSITKECCISEQVDFLPNDNVDLWCKKIIDYVTDAEINRKNKEDFRYDDTFNIHVQANVNEYGG